MRTATKSSLWPWLGVLVCLAAGELYAEYPIAGVKPYQRPDKAPVIKKVIKDEGWDKRALTGLAKPFPPSFKFLADQGNWHTPFNKPGMTGPYDIRGWHQ